LTHVVNYATCKGAKTFREKEKKSEQKLKDQKIDSSGGKRRLDP
jgi:hypothetical protein